MPKVTCNICHRDCSTIAGTYVDGATTLGPWADMCEACFAIVGRGLGTGLGQRYNLVTGKKVAG